LPKISCAHLFLTPIQNLFDRKVNVNILEKNFSSKKVLFRTDTTYDLDPLSLSVNNDVGMILYWARQYDEAIAQYQKTLEMDRNFIVAHWGLGRTFTQKGMYEEAMIELQKAIILSDSNSVYVASLAYMYAMAGNKNAAQKILKELKNASKQRYVSSYQIALIYSALLQKTQAFTWLKKAYEERSSDLILLKVDPRLDNLRPDPRFFELCKKIGLEKQK